MGTTSRRLLGKLLLETGAITEEQWQGVLSEQKRSRKRLGCLLVEHGLISEAGLMALMEEQLNVPRVNLYNCQIDPEVATCIPREMAQRHRVIPIERRDRQLVLAMADPLDLTAQDDVARFTGAAVEPVIAAESAVNHMINQFYGLKESLEHSAADRKSRARDQAVLAHLRARVEDAPIVKVVDSLIQRAIAEGASDIHLEPSGKGLRIRIRIDGILHDLMSPPRDTQPLIISRIKVMANLDIAERRLPQDGNIPFMTGPKEVNLRISTMPTVHGEKVVIRLLEEEKIILPVAELGFSEANYRLLLKMLLNQSGMILVTGPTGCGKTTTLYSALHYLSRPEVNIITVEDPVEYRLAGINQIQVNTRIDLSFAGALRAILRQDPDIIMVGEIRDLETARIATQAALTGHLVLSTLHTNNAAGAVTRLMDMGVERYRITAALTGVVAQRLVRKNCAGCSEPYPLSEKEKLFFASFFEAEPPEKLFRGKGCRDCNHTGYRGRTCIQELLVLNQELYSQILAGSTAQKIQEKAVRQGMVPLAKDGMRMVNDGVTTLQEVVRTAFSSELGRRSAAYADFVWERRFAGAAPEAPGGLRDDIAPEGVSGGD